MSDGTGGWGDVGRCGEGDADVGWEGLADWGGWFCADDWGDVVEADSSVAAEAGGGDFERAVVFAGLEGDDLAVRWSAVLGFELAVDEAVRRPELATATRLWNDGELDLGTVAEVVCGEAEPLAGEICFLAVDDGTEAGLQGSELAFA
ncbi:hypothetical protein EV645_0380 [Kribbella rubisoli]|uniref:Uncharacterized protein n=1 Tax=Kribbella rubisoli TaxID=3075929 RepID=A0A4Q7XI95_9ACTN|nr:hypothetical protein [Kribbella rubisoli]RZU22299.1 hypothetical protein EV645_0380 [Kribbella rubisoli]